LVDYYSGIRFTLFIEEDSSELVQDDKKQGDTFPGIYTIYRFDLQDCLYLFLFGWE